MNNVETVSSYPAPSNPAGKYMTVALIAAAIAIPLFFWVAVSYNITAIWLILGLFGMAFFLPVGAMIGWWVWDPYKRAQLMRWVKRRNYGVVNLVHRTSGYILPLVRDLNESVLIKDNAIWVLRGGKIYRTDKKQEVAELRPEHITYVGGVPTVFLDLESKRPITFKSHDANEATPQEVGATILGYIYNQMTKAIASLKRQWNWMLIGMLVLSVINAYMNYSISTGLDKISHQLAHITSHPATPVTVTPTPAPETNTASSAPAPIPAEKGVAVGGGGTGS